MRANCWRSIACSTPNVVASLAPTVAPHVAGPGHSLERIGAPLDRPPRERVHQSREVVRRERLRQVPLEAGGTPLLDTLGRRSARGDDGGGDAPASLRRERSHLADERES